MLNINIVTLYNNNTLINIFIEYFTITFLVKFLAFNNFFYRSII